MFKQSTAISALNLRNTVRRPGTSMVVVVGIAGVVAVFVGLLAMAAGFQAALTSSAADDRAIILGHGSRNEMNSWLSNDEANIVSRLEGIEASSRELYTAIDLTRKGTNETAYVVARGITRDAFEVRPEIRVVAGRMPEPGRSELLAGKMAANTYAGLQIGDDLDLRGKAWKVVGHFDANGTASESEVWLDLSLAQSVFRRDTANTIRIRVFDPVNLERLRTWIEEDPRLDLTLVPETEFFASQSEVRTTLIRTFTYLVASIMAIGAIVAAVNSMYVAVGSRKVEIATLRAIGFARMPIVTSVLVEALVLSLAGGLVGVALVYLAVDGYSTSTLNTASSTQVAFTFAVTPGLVSTGVVCALFLGLMGGLLPAIQAARAPITTALLGK